MNNGQTADNKTQPIAHMSAKNNTINYVHVEGDGFGIGSTSSSSYVMDQYYPKELKDVIITEETIEIIYVQRAMYTYTTQTITIGGQIQNVYENNDRTFKEIYGTRDGRLTLLKTVEGRVVPPYTVDESFEFDE